MTTIFQNKFSLTVLTFLSLGAQAAEPDRHPGFLSALNNNLSLNFHTKGFVDSESENLMNIDHSNFEMRVSKGRMSLQDFLDRAHELPEGEMFWEFSLRTTLVPTALKGMVSKGVLEKLDQTLAEKKEEGFAQIAAAQAQYSAAIDKGEADARREAPNTVNQLLPQVAADLAAAGDPRLQGALAVLQNPSAYPQSVVDQATAGVNEAKAQIAVKVNQAIDQTVAENRQLLSDTIAQTKKKALADLEAARIAYQKKIKDRLDELQLESSIQEVIVRLGRKTGPNTVQFLFFGKGILDGAFKTDGNRRTELEAMMPISDITTRLLSPYATSQIGWGFTHTFQRANGKKWSIRGELAAFHYRIPYLNGNQFISDFLHLSDEDYAQNKDLWNLDSAFGRLLFDFDRFTFFVSGSAGRRSTIAAGFDWKLTNRNHLQFSFYQGQHNIAQQSFSLYLTHEFSPAFNSYVGYTHVDGMNGGEHAEWGAYDRDEFVLGLRYRMEFYPVLKNLVAHKDASIFVEVYHDKNSSRSGATGDFKKEVQGLRVGWSIEFESIFKSKLERLESRQAKIVKRMTELRYDLAFGKQNKKFLFIPYEKTVTAPLRSKLGEELRARANELVTVEQDIAALKKDKKERSLVAEHRP